MRFTVTQPRRLPGSQPRIKHPITLLPLGFIMAMAGAAAESEPFFNQLQPERSLYAAAQWFF